MTNTKDNILDAAEQLFAERGYEATSMRAITSAAGVNLAAVNYHFHSKERLLQALFTRRLDMLNRRRMELMDRYEAEYGEKPIPLAKLVHVLIEPMLAAPATVPEAEMLSVCSWDACIPPLKAGWEIFCLWTFKTLPKGSRTQYSGPCRTYLRQTFTGEPFSRSEPPFIPWHPLTFFGKFPAGAAIRITGKQPWKN